MNCLKKKLSAEINLAGWVTSLKSMKYGHLFLPKLKYLSLLLLTIFRCPSFVQGMPVFSVVCVLA